MSDIVFRLARPLPLLNVQLRQHWKERANERKDLAWEVVAALGRARPAAPIEFAEIVTWRHSVQQPDEDNLQASRKGLHDVLQPSSERHPYGLGVILGDDPGHLRSIIHHVKAKSRLEQYTLVRIRDLTQIQKDMAA
jgi:hypothetical protein